MSCNTSEPGTKNDGEPARPVETPNRYSISRFGRKIILLIMLEARAAQTGASRDTRKFVWRLTWPAATFASSPSEPPPRPRRSQDQMGFYEWNFNKGPCKFQANCNEGRDRMRKGWFMLMKFVRCWIMLSGVLNKVTYGTRLIAGTELGYFIHSFVLCSAGSILSEFWNTSKLGIWNRIILTTS